MGVSSGGSRQGKRTNAYMKDAGRKAAQTRAAKGDREVALKPRRDRATLTILSDACANMQISDKHTRNGNDRGFLAIRREWYLPRRIASREGRTFQDCEGSLDLGGVRPARLRRVACALSAISWPIPFAARVSAALRPASFI
jgi:hypothetical protein